MDYVTTKEEVQPQLKVIKENKSRAKLIKPKAVPQDIKRG